MKRIPWIGLIIGPVCSVLPAVTFADESEAFWGQWRGPNGSGVALKARPPAEWSEDKNVRWKRALPGQSASTPIVWGDFVYLQTAIPVADNDKMQQTQAASNRERPGGRDEAPGSRSGGRGRGGRSGRRPRPPTIPHKFVIMALERKTGKVAWERILRQELLHEGHHRDGSPASGSPLTDGEHLFAYFGSRGLYCLTMKGEPVWDVDFGDMRTRNSFGEGSSPVLHGDTIVVNWDHEGDSFIIALDKRTREERWKRDRDEATSWSTPLVIRDRDRPQVVVSATNRVRSYDLDTGQTVWECGGLGANCVASPVIGDGLLFAMSGRDPALLAIRYPNARGDLTGSDAVAWKLDGGTPYVPSPLLYGDTLYFAQKNSGFLSCYNSKTGEPHYTRERLAEVNGIYSSLVGAEDRVYILGRNGVTYVLERGPKLRTLAVNRLDDRFTASPAIAGREIYLRGHDHLYCIAAD